MDTLRISATGHDRSVKRGPQGYDPSEWREHAGAVGRFPIRPSTRVIECGRGRPVRYPHRYKNTWLAFTPSACAIRATLAPGNSVSSTIRRFLPSATACDPSQKGQVSTFIEARAELRTLALHRVNIAVIEMTLIPCIVALKGSCKHELTTIREDCLRVRGYELFPVDRRARFDKPGTIFTATR